MQKDKGVWVSMWLPEKLEIGNPAPLWYSRIEQIKLLKFHFKGEKGMLEFIAILMIIDHIGFLWGILVFRIIGRLAMPIFIFNLAKGTLLTKDYPKYLFRLWLFGVC